MHIKKTKEITLNDLILISALPDMGKVGGLVTEHLKKVLKCSQVAKIILQKPWVNQKKGIIDNPTDEYYIFVNTDKKIAVFTGDGQPQEASVVIELTSNLLKTIQEMGKIKMVISAGGYLPGKDDGDVFCVATNQRTLDMAKSHGIKILDGQVNSITWFNGLILGHAKEKEIDGIGLFGKIEDSETPQYMAASNVIKKIAQILDMKIDTAELDEKIVKPVVEEKHSPGIG